MSFQHLGKGALRVAKNYTKGYSDVQAKVRDATSNDPWGPSGTQMNEIAQLTYNQNDFVEIMEMLDKRLNDKGKNWRHVFKALTLLDYCLHAGSENVVIYFRDNVYLVKTLKEFQYVDEYGKDQGANVRQKAKDITNLLQDESRLRQQRRSRANMRDRMTKGGPGNDNDEIPDPVDENAERRKAAQPPRKGRDEEELKRAMEASKHTFEQEQMQKAEDADVKRAIQLSEQDARDRAKAVEDANSNSLFDDGLQPAQTNPFPLVDAGLQPQYTYVQPQFTSFNPYLQAQQEQQQAMMQAQWAQQQAEWAAAQQQAEFAAQQQQLAAQQAQQAQLAMQNEWALQQQQNAWYQQQQQQQQQQQLQLQQQAIAPQPTGFGSRNPFALGSTPSPAPPMPSLSPSISPPPTNGQQLQNLSPSPGPSNQLAVKTKQDENAALAALFANRDAGIDTFGNFGNLRYGSSNAGKVMASNTGAASGNPFGQKPPSGDQPFFSVS